MKRLMNYDKYEKIFNELKECGFNILNIDYVFYITCKNPDYQPDNGSNPFLVCTFDNLLKYVLYKQGYKYIKNDSTKE